MIPRRKISILKLFISCIFILLAKNASAYSSTLMLCKGDSINYNTKDITGTSVAWKWTFKGGHLTGSNAKQTPNVAYEITGTFKTYNETTFPGGTINYDTILVIVKDWPVKQPFYFQKDTGYCSGSLFSLTINSPNSPDIDHLWNTGAKTPSIIVTSKNTYYVDLMIRSTFRTCDSIRRTVTISEFQNPTVALGPDQLMCQNQTIFLDAKGNTGDTYLWSPNLETSRQINTNLPGIYSVEITTPDKCKATDQVELIDSCPHLIFVPNAVSPNADLLNDGFEKIWNFTPKEYTFCIYDRWGELLFMTNDMKESWDCKVNGAIVQQDIYFYKINYLDTDKKWYEHRGTFFVVR